MSGAATLVAGSGLDAGSRPICGLILYSGGWDDAALLANGRLRHARQTLGLAVVSNGGWAIEAGVENVR